jgi:hypothetical protein
MNQIGEIGLNFSNVKLEPFLHGLGALINVLSTDSQHFPSYYEREACWFDFTASPVTEPSSVHRPPPLARRVPDIVVVLQVQV